MPKKDFYVEKPDDIQTQILNQTLDQSLVVTGCAGSGKSIIALHKAKQIQNELNTDYQVIVFTKSLSNYMNSAKEELNLTGRFTYHYQWKKMGCPKSDYIIVDEIQDFTKEEIDEFINASKKHFCFFGDTAQSIFDGLKPTLSIKDIAFGTGLIPFPLYFNYRLPKPVAKITEGYIGVETKYNDGTYKSQVNTIPRIIEYNNYEEQIKAIIRIIKTRGLTDVGIFFPTNPEVLSASKALSDAGINNEIRYNDKIDWKASKNTLNFESSNPKLMTYHSAKGLQFETVFLPNCTIEADGMGLSKQKSLYVAMTRTYDNLYILHSGNLSSFISGSVPVNLYKTTEFDEIEDI